jgi:allantoate deiminase
MTGDPWRIDGKRLLSRLDALARIGADGDGGVTRLAYGPEEKVARELVAGWMTEAGLEVATDQATNVIGHAPGSGPRLATGSHLDTVVGGGRLDGAYGVVAAIEAAAALAGRVGELRHPLSVIAFANEEGANGTPGMVGSHAVAGTLTPKDLIGLDDNGRSLAEVMADAGGCPDQLARTAWGPGSLAGFIELHIEQGPVLDVKGLSAGVVSSITGRVGVEIVIEGRANHAGTTPMDLRRDALVAAAEVVLTVRQLALDQVVRVATCGHIRAWPNVRNVVPGRVLIGAELRDAEASRLDAGQEELTRRLGSLDVPGVSITLRAGQRIPPVPCHEVLFDCVVEATERLGEKWTALPSGAGHDAQVMAALGPVAMIFVPSVDGISHSAKERTAPEDLVTGADVLVNALLTADARLP